jgi:3-oxoacyl-[acyl-carrier-protein] synthase-3
MTRRAVVAGLGTYVPQKVLTNQDLEQIVDTSDEWIVSRTGIKERHIAEPGETTSMMAAKASVRALADAGLVAEDLDFIVCATNTPDTIFPSTAARVQHQLTSKPIPGVDVQAGCTGLIYGMEMASALIQSGSYRNVLVIGADKLTSITDYEDRTTAVLFGDAAGAFVLQGREDTDRGILASYLQADGRGEDLLVQPAGGSKLPASAETVAARQHYLKMNGREIYKFAVHQMTSSLKKAMEACNLTAADVKLVVPHQVNQRIIDSATEKMGFPKDKVFVNIDRYGNTSAASVPLALDEALRAGACGPGDWIIMVAFGAGLTWASATVKL